MKAVMIRFDRQRSGLCEKQQTRKTKQNKIFDTSGLMAYHTILPKLP
jgi:hypothetical protein